MRKIQRMKEAGPIKLRGVVSDQSQKTHYSSAMRDAQQGLNDPDSDYEVARQNSDHTDYAYKNGDINQGVMMTVNPDPNTLGYNPIAFNRPASYKPFSQILRTDSIYEDAINSLTGQVKDPYDTAYQRYKAANPKYNWTIAPAEVQGGRPVRRDGNLALANG